MIMEHEINHDMASVSLRTRKASSIIQSQSKDLRTRGTSGEREGEV